MAGGDDDYRLETVFEDPTPNGHINQRICGPWIRNFEATTYSLLQREQLTFIAINVGKKLVAAWKHRERYMALEDELVAAAKSAADEAGSPGHSQDLYLEFDEFLVQIKSALDTMVKFPEPILGKKVWNLRTFGAKGKDVLSAMANCVPRQYADRMDVLRKQTFEPNADLLNTMIDARDRMNHFQRGGVHFGRFAVRKVAAGADARVEVPMWSSNQTIRAAMIVVWRRLLCFVEEFMGMFYFLALRPGLSFAYRHIEDEGTLSRWAVDLIGNIGPQSFQDDEPEEP
jgi:hypothetical protein